MVPAIPRPTRALTRIVVVASILGARIATAQGAPLSLPLHDAAYALFEGLENSGCGPARVSAYRPYELTRIRLAIEAADRDPMCAPLLVRALAARFARSNDSAVVSGEAAPLAESSARSYNVGASVTARATALGNAEYRPLWDDLRAKELGTPPVVGLVRVRGRYSPTPRTVGVIEAYGQSHARNDPWVRARQLRTTTGVVGISEATFTGAFGPIVMSIGRDREAWFGSGSESLLLSAHAPPLDRLAASFSTRRFEGRAIYAMLDDVLLDTLRGDVPSGTPPQRFHRSLAAHAVTWRASKSLEFSVGEAILISRGSRTLELGYGNPLMPYVLTQHDAGSEGSEVRDNLIVYAGVRARIGTAQLNGEVIVDDIQIDAADREFTPHQLGWRVEGRQGWISPRPGSLSVEYQRLDSYTYLRPMFTDVYQYLDRPLGSELGPDADKVEASLELWPTSELHLTTSAAIWRRGAQRIARRPAVGAIGNAGQPFPTTNDERPLVQRTTLGSFTAELLRWHVPVRAQVELARVANPDHAAAINATYLRAQLSATYAFRYP